MRLSLCAVTICAVFVLSGCAPQGGGRAQAPVEWDGLSRVDVKGLDLVYVRPGVSLAAYDKVMVDPLQISFSKDRDANGGWRAGAFPIGERDRERIRQRLADIVREQLVSEVQTEGGYRIVTEPGPDVLHVSAAIIDLNVTAPDTMSPGRSYVITASKGSMTLVAELRDSESGELLARAVDRVGGNSSFRMELADSVTNAAAAQDAARQWAHILRERLDAARAAANGQMADR